MGNPRQAPHEGKILRGSFVAMRKVMRKAASRLTTPSNRVSPFSPLAQGCRVRPLLGWHPQPTTRRGAGQG